MIFTISRADHGHLHHFCPNPSVVAGDVMDVVEQLEEFCSLMAPAILVVILTSRAARMQH